MTAPNSEFQAYPAMPAEPEPTLGPVPKEIRWIAYLLVANLVLSLAATAMSFAFLDDLVRLTIERAGRAVNDGKIRQITETTVQIRAGVAVVIAVFYGFLLRGVWRGRRWAWRRLVWLSFAGAAGIVFLFTQPYLPVFRVQQALQLVVLAAMAYLILTPAAKAHCPPKL